MSKYTPRTEPGEDVIDVRDIIERVEELEQEREDLITAHDDAETEGDKETAQLELREWADEDASEELKTLAELLEELRGNGGDEQWRGDWYPITMIAEHYFQQYAEELADDIGSIDRNACWPANHIDWEAAARELQQDYSTVEYGGFTYFYR